MKTYELQSLRSDNLGHVLASVGLVKTLAHRNARLAWGENFPSSPSLFVNIEGDEIEANKTIGKEIAAAIQGLVSDWIELNQYTTQLSRKSTSNDTGSEQKEGGTKRTFARDELRKHFDELAERLQRRLAPWVSGVAVEEMADGTIACAKPRTQLSKTPFFDFFDSTLVDEIQSVERSIGIINALTDPSAYLDSFPLANSAETTKTGYDPASTLSNTCLPQTAVKAGQTNPLIEALVLLGIEVISLRPSLMMPRPRIMRRNGSGEAWFIKLWAEPLTTDEIEAYLYAGQALGYMVAAFRKNGKNIVPAIGTFERPSERRFVQRRSKRPKAS